MGLATCCTILCIDDFKAALEVNKCLLEYKGFTVRTAVSASQGLKILEEDSVDLVMVDHRMAGLGGGAVAEYMKRTKPDVPVLLLSGDPGTIPESVLCSVDGLVQKGESPEVLFTAVNNLLARKQLEHFR